MNCFGFYGMILKIFVLYWHRNPTFHVLSSLMFDNVSNHLKIRHVSSVVAVPISLAIFAFLLERLSWIANFPSCLLEQQTVVIQVKGRKVGRVLEYFRPLIDHLVRNINSIPSVRLQTWIFSGQCVTHVITIKIYFLLSSCSLSSWLPNHVRTESEIWSKVKYCEHKNGKFATQKVRAAQTVFRYQHAPN